MNQHNNIKTFDWQGHRGARGLVPENTIPAMLKAIDLGAVTLEMDAVITADKQVILSHEPFFNHEITTKPDGTLVSKTEEKQLNIYTMSYAATQRFDVGSNFWNYSSDSAPVYLGLGSWLTEWLRWCSIEGND